MNEIIAIRTPVIIANEINSIKDQTRTMILCNSIEIGRRLSEAKLLVDHGNWGEWLDTYVDYKKSTANNLMRIFDEYGANQIPLFGDNSKSQALGNLSYTQAVALLGVPDKEEFIQENDIENMSTRDLLEAIKAQKAAEKRAEDAERREKDLLHQSINKQKQVSEMYEENKRLIDKASQAEQALETERQQTKLDVDRLSGLLETAKSNGDSSEKVTQLEKELEDAQHQVQELTDKINEPVTLETVVVEKVPEDIERELEELREKTKVLEKQAAQSTDSIVKYTVYFKELTTGFKNLLGALAEIEEKDPDLHEKYKNTLTGLIGKMSESL